MSILIIYSIPISAAIPGSNSTASLKSNNQNIIVSTANNNNNNNNNTSTPITGQLIYEGQGKIVSQRVISPDTLDGTHKMEVSYSGMGFFNGLNVTEMWTFVNTYKPNGVIQGVGQGIIIRDHKEIASATGYGRGYIKEGGNNIVFPTVILPTLQAN